MANAPDAGNRVNLSGWAAVGAIIDGSKSGGVYRQGSFAQLVIDARATLVVAA